jgi:hypothetical protein
MTFNLGLNWSQFIDESETGITTICVKDPLHAVILGVSKMLDVGVATNLWKQTAVTRIN